MIRLILGLIILCVPYPSSAKKNDNEILMKYRTRSHAWENFFMSWGACSDERDFEKKLAYSHSIMKDTMEKFWDKPYIKRLLLFPIFHFKHEDKESLKKATSCFLKIFDNPFAIPKGKAFRQSSLSVRRKRALASLGKEALSIAGGAFAGFLGNIASDALSGFLGIGGDDTSSTNQVKDVKRWRDMKITNEKVTVVLLGDQRFLKSFKSVIEEFREHVLQCISKQKKLTDVARKFCDMKSQSLDEEDPVKNPHDKSTDGATAKNL
ncbi:uncharacterized protein LOC115220523 [Octopus sinensis]|uniref:Uncharacterized protein LOC115220523 n=1 Tax=Octopus sinensis TaxID=2607531 RepID=A0A6P7T8F1_9MOLL|nr:uncharacterized protein LOC115220523 [Octopus sinensis]XP_029646524.1 uncharacterized protein LOC115220523 [Octopus sinensis]